MQRGASFQLALPDEHFVNAASRHGVDWRAFLHCHHQYAHAWLSRRIQVFNYSPNPAAVQLAVDPAAELIIVRLNVT